jgi:hypothetical protein
MKKKTSSVTLGLIIAFILVAISVILYIAVSDFKQQQKFGYFTFVVLIGGIVYACITNSKENNGNVTFGNLFSFGFKTSAVIACIMVIYTALSLTILFPEMKEKGLEQAREQMETQGKLSESQIDDAISMTDKIMLPLAIGGSLVMYLIIGAISSLIGAAIAKKNPNPTPFESDSLS